MSGKWAKEPPTEPGWYFACGNNIFVTEVVRSVGNLEKISGWGFLWYSTPIELPPAPESEGE